VKSIWKHSTKQNFFREILAHQLIHNMIKKHVLLSPRGKYTEKTGKTNVLKRILALEL